MVSHRLSTIKHADHIIVIDEGSVVEEGTHNSLVKSSGLYAEMDLQQKTDSHD